MLHASKISRKHAFKKFTTTFHLTQLHRQIHVTECMYAFTGGKTFAFAFSEILYFFFIFSEIFSVDITRLQTSFPTIEILYSVAHNYSPVISFLIPILFVLSCVSNLNRSRNSINYRYSFSSFYYCLCLKFTLCKKYSLIIE